MASGLSDAFENEILNYFAKMTGPTFTRTGLYLALSTAAGVDTATGSSMTEVTGTGYARQAITWGTVSGGQVSNSAQVVFTATGGDWTGPILSAYVVDANSGGNVLFWADITSVSLGNGDSLTFAATTGIVMSLT